MTQTRPNDEPLNKSKTPTGHSDVFERQGRGKADNSAQAQEYSDDHESKVEGAPGTGGVMNPRADVPSDKASDRDFKNPTKAK